MSYIRYTQIVLVAVFIVILAGSIVRATQSGMGCPDWPTCFGNIIPPTQQSQVIFQPNHSYKQGQFIIINDSLKYAKQAFVSGDTFNEEDWLQYEKHNYASFNVSQTWIEYINRLVTGLLGFLILFHVIWSYRKYYSTNKKIFWLSFSFLILTLIEAWLGKVVVDTNLHVVKVTAHMLFALLIAIVAVIILHLLSSKPAIENNKLKWLATGALIILLIQIVIGTDVREQIDEIALSLGYSQRELWIDKLNGYFTFHKIFAYVTALSCILLSWQAMIYKTLHGFAAWILIIVFALMSAGFAMIALNIPAAVQPVHLFLADCLFVIVFGLRLRLK